MNIFRGELTDILAKKEALVSKCWCARSCPSKQANESCANGLGFCKTSSDSVGVDQIMCSPCGSDGYDCCPGEECRGGETVTCSARPQDFPPGDKVCLQCGTPGKPCCNGLPPVMCTVGLVIIEICYLLNHHISKRYLATRRSHQINHHQR